MNKKNKMKEEQSKKRKIAYLKRKIRQIRNNWSYFDSQELKEANKTNCFGLGANFLRPHEEAIIKKYKDTSKQLEKYTEKLKILTS